MNNYIKPDKEYSIFHSPSKITRKDYELSIYPNGTKFYYLDNQLHRENAPAIIKTHGYQEWYIHGKLHNLNGPARIWEDSTKQYFIDHKYYDENEFWVTQKKCFKCQQEFSNLYDLKIHLEKYDDSKNMIEYIFKLLLK